MHSISIVGEDVEVGRHRQAEAAFNISLVGAGSSAGHRELEGALVTGHGRDLLGGDLTDDTRARRGVWAPPAKIGVG